MILLKKLEVHNFKQLEDITLRFPDRGSFLIEGANEAGKSSLFEAVYFGLFGRPLVGTNTDLVNYAESAKKASVELEICTESENLLIRREIPKQGNQTAFLVVQSEEGKEIDRITKVITANQRIEKSLKFDGQAFLNSCFVEQKKLGKLEEATSQERRNALSKLINLDFMLNLEEKFKITLEDRNRLLFLKEQEELAGIREELQPIEEQLKGVERKLDLIALFKKLKNQRSNQEEVSRWQTQLAQLESERKELRFKVETFNRFQAMLNELKLLLTNRENANNIKKQAERVQEEIENLVQKKNSLPELERRISRLKYLKRKWDQVQELTQGEKEAKSKCDSLAQEIENLKKGQEERAKLSREKSEIQKRKQELEQDLSRAQRSKNLALGFLGGLGAISVIALILVLLKVFSPFVLFLSLALLPGTYCFLKYRQANQELRSLKEENAILSENEQKLSGKMEAYSTPFLALSPSYSLSELEEELEFWKSRIARLDNYLHLWMDKLEREGEQLKARTRDEVVGAINRDLGKLEDLKKEVSRIEERSNYLKSLTQLLEKSSIEERKHLQNLLALEPDLKNDEDSLKALLAELQKRTQEREMKEAQAKLSELESKMGALQGMISLKEKENQKLLSEIEEICQKIGIPQESLEEGEKIEELENLKDAEETQLKE
ncbi:MAG: AAA family ATPase, partial [bacterium]